MRVNFQLVYILSMFVLFTFPVPMFVYLLVSSYSFTNDVNFDSFLSSPFKAAFPGVLVHRI